MDLVALMVEAAHKERKRLQPKNFDATAAELTSTTAEGERLVMLAVLEAMREAELIIAKPEWHYGDSGAHEWSYDDLIPEALDIPS